MKKKSNNFLLYKLIAVGQLFINIPVMLISFGLPALALNAGWSTFISILGAILSFVVGLGLSWLLWSFLITKWRIWAFNSVQGRDLISLKQMAIRTYLIEEEGSISESTEIRNRAEQQSIKDIAERLSELEEIEQVKADLSTPEKIIYKLSKKDIIAESISMILAFCVGIFVLFTDAYIVGLIVIGIFLFDWRKILYLFRVVKNDTDLEINNKGLKIGLPQKRFINWEQIDDLEINKDSRKMMIEFIDDHSKKELRINLWIYEIMDYELFVRRINVYLDRCIVNLEENKAGNAFD